MITISEAVKRVRRYYIQNKRIPSYKEMCDLFHYKSKRAAYLLGEKLVKEGVLEKDSSGKLIPKRLFLPVRFYGSIKAGYPAPAEDQVVDAITSFDAMLLTNPDASFVLRVSGDSMINAGLFEGDIVVVDSEKQARNGDIVVAFIDNEWTLKYFQKDKDGNIVLIPANEKYPKLYPKQSFVLGGVVVSSVRKYH